MRATLLALYLALAVHAQPKLQFEVASVKPSAPVDQPMRLMAMINMLNMMPAGTLTMPDSGLVRIQNWPLRHLIAAAYRVRDEKVSGPSWMGETYFDIEAKLPAGAKKADANEMLQALLAERFGMEFHRETRELSGFALVVGKNGPKMEESAAPPPIPEAATPEEAEERRKERIKVMQDQMRQRREEEARSGAPRKAGHSTTSWTAVTMGELAGHLTRMAGGPVVDETGLTAKYGVKIETWKATEDEPEETIFQAVEKLGLKLTQRKVSVETLVIDKISKAPTEN